MEKKDDRLHLMVEFYYLHPMKNVLQHSAVSNKHNYTDNFKKYFLNGLQSERN